MAGRPLRPGRRSSSSTPPRTSGWSPTTSTTCSSGSRPVAAAARAATTSCASVADIPRRGASYQRQRAVAARAPAATWSRSSTRSSRELRESLALTARLTVAWRSAPSRGVRRAAGPARSRSTRSSSETAASAEHAGSLLGAGRVRLRVTVKNGWYRTLIPTRAAGRPSRSMSSTTRTRQRAHRRLDLGPVRRGPSGRSSSRPCARGTHGVASTGLGVDAPAEPVVPRPHRRPELGGQHARRRRRASCATVSMPSAASFFAVLRADPPQRVGGPLPHHLEPVRRRSAGRRRAACRSRWRSWPAACCRRCRPSSAAGSPRAPRRGSPSANSRGSPRSPWPGPGPRNASSQPSTSSTHRHAAPLQRPQRRHHLAPTPRRTPDRRPAGTPRRGSCAAATRSGIPEPTPNSRAAYDAVDTTPRSVGSPRPPTTTGSPSSSGWRSISTAAMNWSRSTCSTHCCRRRVRPGWSTPARPVAGAPRSASPRRRQRVGGLERVEAGEQQQVDDHRPDLGQDHLGRELVGALDLAGRVADLEQRLARLRRPSGCRPARRRSRRAASASSAQSTAYDVRHRPSVVRRDRGLPDQHPGAAQRPVERVDQLDHPPHAGRGAGPGTARTRPRTGPRRRRPAARG